MKVYLLVIEEEDMPTYEYECENCSHCEEKFASVIEAPKLIECPECGKMTLVKCLGSGCGFNLNGEGYYHGGWN